MKKYVGMLFMLLSCSLLSAEKITLNEALERAYENNYDYQNAKIDMENTDLKVREGYKSAGPKLEYNGGYSVAPDDNKFRLRNGTVTNQRLNHQLGITQPIYNGGIIYTGISVAKKSQELMSYRLAKSKSDLKLGVIQAYLNVLAEQQALDVYKSSLKEVKEAYDLAERKYQLDVISKSDYLPLKTKYISAQADLEEAENKLEITKIRFKNLIGMPVQEKFELENLKFRKYDLKLVDLEGDIKYALSNNKESKISKLNTEIVEESEKISRADLLPKINANLRYNSEDEHMRNSMDKWYWTAGITVNWTLFDFGKSWDTYSRSKNETEKARNQERKTLDNLEVQIRTNYISLVRLNGTLQARQAEVDAAKENYELQKKKYNSGVVSIIDYLLYETQLNNSQLALIKTKLDYYYAYDKYLETLK